MSEHDIEATLLKLLLAGVSSLGSELHTTYQKDGREMIYLSLEDLKALMEAREAFWPPETHKVYQNLELPTPIQKPNLKRTMPVADTGARCPSDDSPHGMDQDATHRSKKTRLPYPAEFKKPNEVTVSNRSPGDPEDPKTALLPRKQPNQHAADANVAKTSGHEHNASFSAREEIPARIQTNVQPAPSPIGIQENWQLTVIDSERNSPGRSFSNWLGDDDDLPLLPVDEMVDCKNHPDYYGETTDKPTLTQPQMNRQLGFPANPAHNYRSVDKDQDEVVPPGFWRRNRLY